jgi:hypothetical protein
LNIKDVREYLGRLFSLEKDLRCIQLELETYREARIKMTVSYGERISGGEQSDKLAIFTSKIIEKENELDDINEQIIQMKNDISFIIWKLEDSNQRLVLVMRYICFMTWEQIAKKMEYELRYIYKIRKMAEYSVLEMIKSGEILINDKLDIK